MKRIIFIIILHLSISGCSDYDDSDVRTDVDNLNDRIATLELFCDHLNNNICSLQKITEELQSQNYLTNVSEIEESNNTIGYQLTYNDGTTIDLYQGITNNLDGKNGTNGSKGLDGDNGLDGIVPSIAVTLYEGRYYWSLNGALLHDESNCLIPAVGINGTTGHSVIVPQLRINTTTEQWEVSYDNGAQWTTLGTSKGTNGKSSSLFKSVNNNDVNFFEITFNDNTQVKIPKIYAISITTSFNSVTMLPSASQQIDYTLSGLFTTSTIETIVSEKDWYVVIFPSDAQTGKIIITAPNVESSAEILIFVYNNNVSTTIHKIIVEAKN